MKMVKSLILGSAAGLVAIAGAQAADLPVKAKPVQYVKICSLYGAGFYYIPGTDTCIKIGGFVRAEINYQAGGSFKPFGAGAAYNFDNPGRDRTTDRARGGITVDARSQTAYGTLRAYATIFPTSTNDGGTGGSPYASPGDFAPALFIQFAGFTAGKTASFFDFDLQPYSNETNLIGSNQAGNGITVFAYTAQFGNGFSASLSAEDETSRRTSITGDLVAPATQWTYQGRRYPDVVANLRIDQAWGSAQVMGALHDVAAYGVTAAGASPSTDSSVGWAVGAGLKFNLPMIGAGDYVIGQIAYSEGAMNYIGSNFGAGAFAGMLLQSGYSTVTNSALGAVFDGVVTGGSLDLTKGWSITGGFEHRWNPAWKSSIYGGYLAMNYSDAASATLALTTGGAGSADWSMWDIGTRTVWTPVENLDLSLDVLYTDVNKSSFDGSTGTAAYGTFGSKGIVSAIFRVQRNFWP